MDSRRQEDEWCEFFEACLTKRISAERFSILWPAFRKNHDQLPLQGVAAALLNAARINGSFVDPRLPVFMNELLYSGTISLSSFLSAALPTPPRDGSQLDQSMLETAGIYKPSLPATVIQLLTAVVSDRLIGSTTELAATLKVLARWLDLFHSSAALGYFISAILATNLAQTTLVGIKTKDLKETFGRAISQLISNLSSTNIQLASNLDYWQKQYELHDEGPTQSIDLLDSIDLGAISFQESVLDNAPTNTRAGLYVYLNAMLHGRPLFDDMTMMNYLNTRYKNDFPALVTELILASFDVMANAMYREEPPQSQIHLRSFLVNKLPVFLNNYSSMIFPPLNMEYCISQALLRVDPAAFPSFSQMFDILDKNSMLSEARQEFLFACALHQLIPEQSIEGLLGDVPMQSLPASGRYVKNNLVSLCTANPAKIDDMIGELENFEGNAGEIVGALIEIMSTLCSNNDTMTLRGICNSLVRRAAVCDTVMLFTSAQTLLQPLCQLLDNWQEQEDQGESQPMYDEFGSILLFVSTVFHHFDIDYKELGVEGPNSFCIKYFQESSESRHVNLLTERESDQLGGWIRGLFETEGISDEVMSMCKPKEFHLLVATLFDQSLKACQAKILSLETLKGGLEYLLEPFLLPSLVAGLTFVTHKLWETKESSASIDTLIPALETLLRPPSSSTSDSSAIHAAVLSIVARPLDDALMHAQRQHRSQTDIAPLLDILKPHTQRQQRKSAAYQELKTWTATPGGGLLAALNSTIQSLLLWSTSTEMPPPNYTHRMLLEAVHVLGAKAVLKLLVDEIVTQFSSAATDETGANAQQDGEMLMDVVTSLIVAPTGSVGSPLLPTRNLPIQHSRRQHGLSLRNALQTEFAGAYELSKSNLARAEAVVRLHRRAEYFVGVGGSGVRGGVGDGLNGGAGVAGGGQDLAAGLGVDVSGANGAMGVDVDADGSMLLDQTQGAPDIDDVLKDAGRRISTAAGAAGAGGFMEAEDAFLGIG